MTIVRSIFKRRRPFFWTGSGAAVLLLLTWSGRDTSRYDFGKNLDRQEAAWVDSVFNTMTDEERVGQLIMLRAHSDKDSAYEQEVENQIRTIKPGGLCFFQGTPERQAELTNRYQTASPRVPLMLSMDVEWGLAMRLQGTIAYPKQLMLGALRNNRLVYDFGLEMARQCRRLGVHVSFSPVADVNNNPANPVINDRSFGEDRYNVAAKSFQYAMGLQDGGVLACAKHFPGHGDTNVDSHYELPVLTHTRQRLDSLELFPFRALSQAGTGSVMVAHLNVPSLDDRPNRPTTLSRNTVYALLRERMGFDGLIFTDAMEMKGVAKYFAPGQADVEALRAGNDVILLPADPYATVQAVMAALADTTLDREQLYASTRRVLRAKYRLRLTAPQYVDTRNLRADLNRPAAQLLKRRLVAEALTLVRDEPGLVGFPELEKHRFASLALGDTNRTVFQRYCGYYAPMDFFNTGKEIDSLALDSLLPRLAQHDVVLVSLHSTRSRAADNFGLTAGQLELIRRLDSVTTVVLTVFGNPYSLKHFDNIPVVLQAFTEDPVVQEIAAQALFGASDLVGVLPVTASPLARYGQGIQRRYPQPRLGYTLPEAVGLDSDSLRLLDRLVQELIDSSAAPGCQILVARDNQIVWHRAYGHLTYAPDAPPVTLDHIYDLASVTKIAATTLSVMRLTGEGRLQLDRPASAYVAALASTNKRDLTLRELLVHQAGLQAWIPFYQQTLVGGNQPSPLIYRTAPEPGYTVPVANGLYMADAWVDSVWRQIYASPLRADKSYKYSDLGLFLTRQAVENVSRERLDRYTASTFYEPLGLSTATFNPWERGWTDRCVPTEDDVYWRQRRVQGYVHDMGAAMLGGVSGHAGLFANANDLAKIFQLFLNGGSYGGRQYVKADVVRQFTTRHPGSTRRGIGFDMKELNPKEIQNISPLAGSGTYGHTGFTGIGVWADPDERLIFIFMSNRTFPSMNNNKLMNADYRPKLQSVVYRALKDRRATAETAK
jgi:beta-N-acetylhexosaminidase